MSRQSQWCTCMHACVSVCVPGAPAELQHVKLGITASISSSARLWPCCTASLFLHPHLPTGSGLTRLPAFSTLSPFHMLVHLIYQCCLSLRLSPSLLHSCGLSLAHFLLCLQYFLHPPTLSSAGFSLLQIFFLHIIQMGCKVIFPDDVNS